LPRLEREGAFRPVIGMRMLSAAFNAFTGPGYLYTYSIVAKRNPQENPFMAELLDYHSFFLGSVFFFS
jgi:hypothetical protein